MKMGSYQRPSHGAAITSYQLAVYHILLSEHQTILLDLVAIFIVCVKRGA
jgi:hypothetical protein